MKCFRWLSIPVESIRDPRADDTSAGRTRLTSSAPPLPRHAILEHIQVTESEKKRGTGCDNPACVTGKIVLSCAPTGIPSAFRFHVFGIYCPHFPLSLSIRVLLAVIIRSFFGIGEIHKRVSANTDCRQGNE